MFENVLGQDAVCQSLRTQLEGKTLPRAILLHGPRFSGKLSCALELARGLQCENGRAKWGCTCPSCTSHRNLLNPALLILGPRYFLEEISAATQACLREPREGTRYLVLRSVRKLVMRFEQILWEGEEQKLGRALPHIEALETELEQIELGLAADQAGQPGLLALHDQPGQLGSAAQTKLGKSLAAIRGIAEKLVALLPHGGYSVGAIRRVQAWAHLKSVSSRRVVILEDAERMNDSVRNSLLKLLEEPPGDFYCILLTSRLSGIIPTLRSRLRIFHMPERSPADEAQVLAKIFRLQNPGPTDSLRSVLGESEAGELAAIHERALAFAEALRNPKGAYATLSELGDWFDAASPAKRRRWIETFLEYLRQAFREDLHGSPAANAAPSAAGGSPAANAARLRLANSVFRESESAFRAFAAYNTSARSLLEQIFFAGSGAGA